MASSSKPWEQPSTQEGSSQPSLCRICNRCSLCRICNSTLIIIMICNPFCSYHSHYYVTTTSNNPFSFVVSETERIIVLQIANPYNILRQITNLPQRIRKKTKLHTSTCRFLHFLLSIVCSFSEIRPRLFSGYCLP